MKNHWVKEFYNLARSNRINSEIDRVINGWVETIIFSGKIFFTKSATYNLSRKQYFQGVDPHKISENGDFILICGGVTESLSDIFIIPWGTFFKTLKKGEPINTYKPPKEYYQYKFYLRNRDDVWLMSVQGGSQPVLDVSSWYYDVSMALKFIGL